MYYVTFGTFAVLLALIAWGGKFADIKKTGLHEDSTSLEVTKCLRGLAAIGVILHHISQQGTFQRAGGKGHPGELSTFVNAGFLFVAVFFFCSGFGLIKSLNKKENYLDGFLKKRVWKAILIPFYVNVVLYAIYHICVGDKFVPAQWVTNFLGLTLMNGYAWYPVVLTILYVAFYFIFKNIKNRKVCFALIFAVIFLMGTFFSVSGHFAWWAGEKNWWLQPDAFNNAKWWMRQSVIWFFGEWWVNSAIAFLIGMIIAQYEEQIRAWFRKYYWLKLIGCIVLYLAFHKLSGLAQWKLGYHSEWSGNGPGILNKLICFCAQLPEVTMFVIMVFAIMLVYHVENPVLRFFGNLSYETYMMNLIALNVFRFLIYENWKPVYKTGNWNLAVYEVCVLAATVALGLLFKYINKLVYKVCKI